MPLKILRRLAVVSFILIRSGVLLAEHTAAEEPIARIAVVSNPYITTLPAAEIKDENGRVRGFLAKTAPESMKKTVELVNQLKPDAFVVLGSLTWSGSTDDFAAVKRFLDQVHVPVFVTPGHRDKLADSMVEFRKLFGKKNVENSVQSVRGVALAFAGELNRDPDLATSRLLGQFAENDRAKAVLLFSGLDGYSPRSKLTEGHQSFWKLVDEAKIAARFEPTRYDHQLGYMNTLPVWTVASAGWSARGAVTLVEVYPDRIEMAQVADPQLRSFSLTVPNPVTAPRMKPAAADPYGCPSYSLDLAENPDFTFALVSDPQFDRKANRDYLVDKAQAAIEELNRLKPEMVFVAGDLVNNNLPEEWELFNRVFADLKPDKYVVPGNHDVLFNYDFVEQSYASASRDKPEYNEIVLRALKLARAEGFTQSTALYEKYTGSKPRQLIEHRDCAFITVPFLTTRADAEQIEFLRAQLKRASEKRYVFVVAHYPALPAFGNNLQPKLGGSEVLSILHEHSVTGYLFGHRHRNGFQIYQRTAHVLADNMLSIHLFHVFKDRIVIGKKRVKSPLYEKLIIDSPRVPRSN